MQESNKIALPNPLIVHGIDYPVQFRRYIERRGGWWTEDLCEGRTYIGFPEGAYIEEVEQARPDYAQVFISFPDGGFIVWLRVERPDGLYSRLLIPGDAFELVGEIHPAKLKYLS